MQTYSTHSVIAIKAMGLSDLTADILGIPEPSARFLLALYGGEFACSSRVHVDGGNAHPTIDLSECIIVWRTVVAMGYISDKYGCLIADWLHVQWRTSVHIHFRCCIIT